MVFPEEYFRAGAGSVIINEKGLTLALERSDIPGAWQLPQGGLDAGEEPLQAALRETFEETGIPENALKLLDAYPEPLAYELPVSARSVRNGRGQAQYWFLFRFCGSEALIDIVSGAEFRSWSWIPFRNLLETVAEFRRPVYQRLAERFNAYLLD